MKSIISVIIPIYNVEKWLPSCINSILNQSFKNIELILVNDGSKDRSREICEEYAKKDNRIKVINQNNCGVSSARNTGIKVATGKYVTFIDPDDTISQEYFETMYSIAELNKCDAVVSGYINIPSNKISITNFKLYTIMHGQDFVLSSSNIHSNNDLCFVWRYIYKLNIIKEKNITFNENIYTGSDVVFNLEYLLECNRVYAIEDQLYYYTENRDDSIMRTPYKPRLESSLILQYKIRKKLSQKFGLLNYNHYKKDMANYYIKNIYNMIIKNLKSSNSSDIYCDLKRIVKYEMFYDSLKEISFSYKCHNKKEYLYYLALKFRIYPVLYLVIKRDLNRIR